jgi:S1-C subfamily serine protease
VNGVVVVDVMNGSPAAQAGLRPCDLILSVGGKAVSNPSEVQLAVDQAKVGSQLAIELQRGGSRRQITVKPAELPKNQ